MRKISNMETVCGRKTDGYLVSACELNKIVRHGCKGLTYLMNVVDANDNRCITYMWFIDDDTDERYLLEIDRMVED